MTKASSELREDSYLFVKSSRTFPSSVTSSSTNDSNKAPKRRLTLSMFIITVIFIICFSFDSVYYLLGRFEVLVYVYNSPIQRVGVILITINSVLNPIIYFSLMKKFRLRMYTLFWTKYKLSDTTVDTS